MKNNCTRQTEPGRELKHHYKVIMKKRHRNVQIYFIVSFAAILCYINSLSGDFVHDDLPAIVYNRDVLGTSPLADILVNDFWGMRMKLKESHKSYRPLTTLSFRYCAFRYFCFLIFQSVNVWEKKIRSWLTIP